MYYMYNSTTNIKKTTWQHCIFIFIVAYISLLLISINPKTQHNAMRNTKIHVKLLRKIV